MPNAMATPLATLSAPTTPAAEMAELMIGFASMAGPHLATPRYVNTASRHCISRKPTTTKSPKRLLGCSHCLTKPAIGCPREGAATAYFSGLSPLLDDWISRTVPRSHVEASAGQHFKHAVRSKHGNL